MSSLNQFFRSRIIAWLLLATSVGTLAALTVVSVRSFGPADSGSTLPVGARVLSEEEMKAVEGGWLEPKSRCPPRTGCCGPKARCSTCTRR